MAIVATSLRCSCYSYRITPCSSIIFRVLCYEVAVVREVAIVLLAVIGECNESLAIFCTCLMQLRDVLAERHECQEGHLEVLDSERNAYNGDAEYDT